MVRVGVARGPVFHRLFPVVLVPKLLQCFECLLRGLYFRETDLSVVVLCGRLLEIQLLPRPLADVAVGSVIPERGDMVMMVRAVVSVVDGSVGM